MPNTIILLSIATFFILFSFLLFIFFVTVISAIKGKKRYGEFVPRVSIIIPAFNEEKNIEACLNSIKYLNYPKEKIEVIVVDDGSDDETIKIAEKFGVKTLNQEHLGKVDTLNNGVKISSGEFIFTIDADTILDKECLIELIRPFLDESIGATNGAVKAKTDDSLLGIFQNIEYHYNNLIRHSFSRAFNNGIWFFGAIACYRKSILEKIGMFKKDTITEDMDIAMELKSHGYKTINVRDAFGYTNVPSDIKSLYRQRARWWVGGLQTLAKNRKMFSVKQGITSLFLFVNQIFWSIYAVISLPLIIYQFNYWLPYNSSSIANLFVYTFRWFSLYGPVWVIYKLPANGISYFTFFGVISGILSTAMIVFAIKSYKERLSGRHVLAIFFYFPYTIILNIIIVISLFSFSLWKKGGYFIK